MSESQVTSVSEWKREAKVGPLQLPSGKNMKVRRSNFRAFMSAGIVPNALMAVVQSSIAKGTQPDVGDLTGDPQKMAEMLAMIDSVTVFCAQEPKVYPVPKDKQNHEIPLDERDQELLYVDEIGEEDKSFIFQWVTGGTSDLAQFRDESPELVAAAPGRKVVASKTKSVTRNRR